jgi:hypothetical protein
MSLVTFLYNKPFRILFELKINSELERTEFRFAADIFPDTNIIEIRYVFTEIIKRGRAGILTV